MSAAEHEAAIAQLLAELGDTADAVADTLRAKGIKGRREDPTCCPVARYVQAGADFRLLLISLYDGIAYVGKERIPFPTPPQVGEFIDRFDRGVYLDLVEVDG